MRGIRAAQVSAKLTPEQIESLHEVIKHGDADHHAWLREAIVAWSRGDPPPPVRGSGRKEAEILRLTKQLEELSHCPEHS